MMHSFIFAVAVLGLSWSTQAAPAAAPAELDARFFLVPSIVYPTGFNKDTCPVTSNVLHGKFQTKRSVDARPSKHDARDVSAVFAPVSEHAALEARKSTGCSIIGEVIFENIRTGLHNTETWTMEAGKRYVFRVAADVAIASIESFALHLGRWILGPKVDGGHTGATLIFTPAVTGPMHFLINFANSSPDASGNAVLFEES